MRLHIPSKVHTHCITKKIQSGPITVPVVGPDWYNIEVSIMGHTATPACVTPPMNKGVEWRPVSLLQCA